jgi:hypothetical protein
VYIIDENDDTCIYERELGKLPELEKVKQYKLMYLHCYTIKDFIMNREIFHFVITKNIKFDQGVLNLHDDYLIKDVWHIGQKVIKITTQLYIVGKFDTLDYVVFVELDRDHIAIQYEYLNYKITGKNPPKIYMI